MKPAVFIDRDGTVNEEMGYINHIDRFRIFPWTAEAIGKLNRAGIPAILITNQSGVARGYFPESLVDEIHQKLLEELARHNAWLDGIYYCPHHPEAGCKCRKPSPGMLNQAASDLDLDPASSFTIGDRYQDLRMGFPLGIKGILVMTGYGKGECLYQSDGWPRQPDHLAENLLAGVDWILSHIPGVGSHEIRQ
jgi:D-glycero-D-manno-heptose 1,7-bisphosphate phosphatase